MRRLNDFGKFAIGTVLCTGIALIRARSSANPKAPFTLPDVDGKGAITLNLGWGHCAPHTPGCTCPDGRACTSNGLYDCCPGTRHKEPKAPALTVKTATPATLRK